MPIGIIQARPQEEDPLDKVAKAVNIARSIYGIYADTKTLDQALADKQKQKELIDLQLKDAQRKESEFQADNDPNSPIMKSIREAAAKRGMTLPEGTTPKQARTNFDAYLKPNDPKQRDPLQEELVRARIDELKTKRDFEKSPEGRISKLNSGDKARFDNAKLGLQSIQEMDAALNNGDNTFSLFGDNDYTRSLRLAAEAFGRMQSGGAISKDEEERFLATAPGVRDSKEQQRAKLQQMQRLFADRLQTLGFSTDEAGVPFRDVQYGQGKSAVPTDIQAEAKRILEQRRAQAKK